MSQTVGAPVTIVLGGIGSIGEEVVAMLQQLGHHVIVGGRISEKLRCASEDFGYETFKMDALNPESIEQGIAGVAKEHGKISRVANCIGSILLKPAHLTTDEEFADVLQTNLWSSFATVRGAAKAMRKTGGSAVLVSTAATRIGIPNHEAIAAAKTGVEGLARSATATYANAGMRVNVVAPGLVKSEMSRRIWDNETAAASSREMHALGRLGEPRDVASMIAWLLDPMNDWITGQVIGIDGGFGSIVQRQRYSPKNESI